VTESLGESEFLDYYNVREDGGFEHIAQTRQCAGSCSDPVEGIAKRGVRAVIIAGLSPNALLKFHNAGIRVFNAKSASVPDLIREWAAGRLEEVGMDQYSSLRRK
jgi:predicted Fe-Mo cluster-binding NifX family protein